jgi:antitoxin MazE
MLRRNILTATITKWGNSQGIRLPKTILEKVNWTHNDTVEIVQESDCLIISKPFSKKHKTTAERLSAFMGDITPTVEMNWGKSEGEESW